MIVQKNQLSSFVERDRARRQYRSPSLIVFGKIAILTQAQSGVCQGDAAGCQPNMTGTTGAMA